MADVSVSRVDGHSAGYVESRHRRHKSNDTKVKLIRTAAKHIQSLGEIEHPW